MKDYITKLIFIIFFITKNAHSVEYGDNNLKHPTRFVENGSSLKRSVRLSAPIIDNKYDYNFILQTSKWRPRIKKDFK